MTENDPKSREVKRRPGVQFVAAYPDDRVRLAVVRYRLLVVHPDRPPMILGALMERDPEQKTELDPQVVKFTEEMRKEQEARTRRILDSIPMRNWKDRKQQ